MTMISMQTMEYDRYKALLGAIKAITQAHDCSIFLLGREFQMEDDEKAEIFASQLNTLVESFVPQSPYEHLLRPETANHPDAYDVLTFFTGTESPGRWRIRGYKERPRKYIVLNWKDRTAAIPKEGLTAFCARTGLPLVLTSRQKIEDHPSFAGANEGDNSVHGHCHQVALMPIRDPALGANGVLGVLRCDVYGPAERPFTEDGTLNAIIHLNDTLFALIRLGRDLERAYSYVELFRGARLLDSLREISNLTEGDADKQVYRYTKKLFFVLRRRRYFGYEAILTRVRDYLLDVADVLGFSRDLVASLLDNFRRQEDLFLYSSRNYRDHFMHQFHVFVAGYILLHYIGSNRMVQLVGRSLSRADAGPLEMRHVLRTWFLAACFHDCAYLLQELDEDIGKFLSDMLSGPGPQEDGFRFRAELQWEQLALGDPSYLCELSHMLDYFPPQTTIEGKRAWLCSELSRLMLTRDHGVLGAMIMARKMMRGNTWKEDQFTEDEVYMAGLAIALHTKDAFECAARTQVQKKVYFEAFPIAFLLTYCDHLQEWGRRTTEKARLHGAPTFHSFSRCEGEMGVECNLVYETATLEAGQTVPSVEKLRGWSQPLELSFASLSSQFRVNYFVGATMEDNLESARRIDHMGLKDRLQRRGLRTRCGGIHTAVGDGRSIWVADCSLDGETERRDLGFGSDEEFRVGEEIDVRFGIRGMNLSGSYCVKRVAQASRESGHKYFIGALSCGVSI
ncbi:MAG: hypothetical protein JXB46_00820 [Candidatus Eisenbacteria bacterium]|nr:hypothetical protein [Candidatus Eisenbacteria bacterium]